MGLIAVARAYLIGPWRLSDLIQAADEARDRRDWRTAARLYRRASIRSPGLTSIWVQYGHALKESGNLRAAELAYLRALFRGGSRADTYLQLGHCFKLQERYPEAIGAYLTSNGLDPKLPDARSEIAAFDILAPTEARKVEQELRAELAAALTTIETLTQGNIVLNAVLDAAKNEAAVNEQLRGQLAVLERNHFAEIAAVETALAEARHEISQLQDRCQFLERAESETRALLEFQLAAVRRDLQRALKHAERTKMELHEAFEAELAGYRNDLKLAASGTAILEERLGQAERSKAGLQALVEELRGEIADWRSSANIIRRKEELIQAIVVELEAELALSKVQPSGEGDHPAYGPNGDDAYNSI
jgi:tetratricopeptide (TPR) repeat protein